MTVIVRHRLYSDAYRMMYSYDDMAIFPIIVTKMIIMTMI